MREGEVGMEVWIRSLGWGWVLGWVRVWAGPRGGCTSAFAAVLVLAGLERGLERAPKSKSTIWVVGAASSAM